LGKLYLVGGVTHSAKYYVKKSPVLVSSLRDWQI
jgi:hypothetical protein